MASASRGGATAITAARGRLNRAAREIEPLGVPVYRGIDEIAPSVVYFRHSMSKACASCKSAVSKPSVNQP